MRELIDDDTTFAQVCDRATIGALRTSSLAPNRLDGYPCVPRQSWQKPDAVRKKRCACAATCLTNRGV